MQSSSKRTRLDVNIAQTEFSHFHLNNLMLSKKSNTCIFTQEKYIKNKQKPLVSIRSLKVSSKTGRQTFSGEWQINKSPVFRKVRCLSTLDINQVYNPIIKHWRFSPKLACYSPTVTIYWQNFLTCRYIFEKSYISRIYIYSIFDK